VNLSEKEKQLILRLRQLSTTYPVSCDHIIDGAKAIIEIAAMKAIELPEIKAEVLSSLNTLPRINKESS
tara:strand:+ start:25153 stop:25359 length:207 start_codon:yes stop_codon:yes gene_type:complete